MAIRMAKSVVTIAALATALTLTSFGFARADGDGQRLIVDVPTDGPPRDRLQSQFRAAKPSSLTGPNFRRAEPSSLLGPNFVTVPQQLAQPWKQKR